jgi:Fic family protein
MATQSNPIPEELLTKPISYWLLGESDPAQYLKDMLADCEKPDELTDYLPKFRDLKAVSFIYASNKLQGTIPKGASEHETYQMLEKIMHDDDNSGVSAWKADGSGGDSTPNRSQMLQHIRAYKHLCSLESLAQPLTAEKIKETHRILLTKAVNSQGKEISCGEYRTVSVHATGYLTDHVYPDHTCIHDKMEKIIHEYNNSTDHMILRAAKLFYETITLHPFIDGNGRLCRLLIAYALMKDGNLYPISLAATKSTRKHYMKAILRVRTSRNEDDYSFLVQMILYSLYTTKKNYENNVKRAKK